MNIKKDEVHISSLVVQLEPQYITSVRRVIEARGDAEIAAADPSGKLVVVLTTENSKTITHFTEDTTELKGVMSVSMVYHQVEQPHKLDEAIS